MSMMQTYRNITKRTDDERRNALIEGFEFLAMEDVPNDYHKEQLPVIPAGTVIIADFAGDFGMYGMAEVDGVLHKVKVVLSDLHKINFGDFDAREVAA